MTPRPRWLRPGAVAVTLVLGLIALVVDGSPGAVPHEGPWQPRVAAVLLIVGVMLMQALLDRIPAPLFVAVIALPATWLSIVRDGAAAFMCVVAGIAWVAATSSERPGLIALGVAMAAAAAGYLLNSDPEGWLGYSVGLGLTWFSIRGLLRQQRLLAELRAAQSELALEAQAAERRRIAHEIHDAAAHTLAVTMLQLTGVRMLLQRGGGDPRAIEALAEAERLGRQGLDDVRRTVGLLSDSRSGEPSPPGAGAIPRLVDEYRDAGLVVELTIDGDLERVPAAAGTALYRVTQESLANVVKHAPGARASVDLTLSETLVRLTIRNDAGSRASSAPSSGHGILGMRERASLLAGTLIAGPDGYGWRVTCELPLARE